MATLVAALTILASVMSGCSSNTAGGTASSSSGGAPSKAAIAGGTPSADQIAKFQAGQAASNAAYAASQSKYVIPPTAPAAGKN